MTAAFLRAALAFALGTNMAAAEVPTCDPDRDNCSRFAACVSGTSEIIRGTSFGIDAGTIYAQSDKGVTCQGTWRRGFMGVGLARFTCDDGRSGQAAYTWLDPRTGTATGTGSFDDGTLVRFWSGNNLASYFRSADPNDLAALECTPADLLLS